jgi:hypothetical protein
VGNGMTPEYFKHHLRPYEAEAYMRGILIGQRAGWEQARMIVSPWRDKDSEPIVYPWEDQEEKPKVTKEDIDNVREWAAQVATMMNTNGRKGDSSKTRTQQ